MPKPDFILRSCGLFLSNWDESLETGEQVVAHLRENSEHYAFDKVDAWCWFENTDGDTLADLIEDHATTLEGYWQEDYDQGLNDLSNAIKNKEGNR